MTTMVDTSAWIEFLRGTGSAANVSVRDGLRRAQLVTTDPVILEVLAGARDRVEEERLAALLGSVERIPCERSDYVDAARIYQSCRRAGETVRGMFDCLVAAVAIRTAAPMLHGDRDFDVIARHSALELA